MIKVCTLCSGYDSQMLAMKRIEKDFGLESELVAWSEIDQIPIKAHNALFPEYADRNLGDMTKIDWTKVEDFDLLTYSTPCTNISVQGRQEGFKKDSGTASSIIWYTEEGIKIKKPKYLLMENVKQMVSKRYIEDFKTWLSVLESYGYKNYYKVLDSANYGIPQHRERIFIVSVLGDEEYSFPEAIKLDKELYDYLEPIDPEWIYNPKYLHNFHRYEVKKNKSPYSLQVIGNVFKSDFNSDNVYNAFKHENDIDKTISPTCMLHHGTSIVLEREDENGNPIIVKLTPREMLQLMGCTKENVNVMQNAIGRTGLLKVAGNSIVVDVLYHIFKSMFIK